MKQVNFSHSGGFPLEQETLERLQTAYRYELFEALKSHLGIKPENDYIVAPPTSKKLGWAIIHPLDSKGVKTLDGILYPIQIGTPTNFLKTTRTGTSLTYGTGVLQTAYFDYDAQYISPADYANRPESPQITDALAIHYYDLKNPAFIVIKDIKTIEGILDSIEAKIKAIQANIGTIEADIKNYLPLDGSKAMKGDLNLDIYQLSKLDIKESSVANVRVTDFRLGSALGRALVDGSNQPSTSLSLNYQSDWENTNIGGKVFLNNINASNATGSLLVIDNANQVTKSNTLIDSLLNRITALENKPATAVPIGMIAIWGKPAPFPEGWEEHVPLRGRMPVGFDSNQLEFDAMVKTGGNKSKNLVVAELPEHNFSYKDSYFLSDELSNNFISGREDTEGLYYATGSGDNNNRYLYYKNRISANVGSNQSFSLLNPYKVVHFIEYTGNITEASDTIAPISPTNITATNIGTKSLTLNWTASTDNIGITNYFIYKDNSNTPLAELGKDILTYNVTGLFANTSYSFQVRAKDAAGNLSTPATVTTATIAADLTAPTVPSYFHCVHNGQGYIHLEWNSSQDDDSPIDYELSRSAYGSLFTVLKKNTDTFYGEKVSSNGTYTYRIRAIDPSGNASAYKETSITISSL